MALEAPVRKAGDMAEERRSSGRPAQGSGRPRTSGGAGGGKPSGRGGEGKSFGAKSSGGKSSGGKPSGGKSYGSRDGARDGGARSGDRPKRGDAPKSGWGKSYAKDGSKDGAGRGKDSRPGSGRDARSGGGKPSYAGKGGSSAGRGGERRSFSRDRREEPEARTADQVAYDGPDLPEEITGKELDRGVAAHLKGLPDKLAARIARHLAAAGIYIDDDPELAYQHAKAAKSRAQRIAVIREALGEAAYAAGHYAEALSELRAAKRMNGATAYLPIMADCHRALGHPEQAIKLAHSPSVVNFKPEAKAEMTLVEAGARRDMGQMDAALRVLELSPLNNKSRGSWVVRLRYAYADTLEAAGRLNEALQWFHRTHAIDADDLTDAAARAEDLERRVERD
jgi:hypothetical protein